MRIGILIPEFPGQTHAFFAREIRALARNGIEVETASTRRPPAGLISHSWSLEAMRSTSYLAPPRAGGVARAVRATLTAGPLAWFRCARSWATARGIGAAGRLRLLGLIAAGAELADIARARGWSHLHCHSCGDAAHVALFAHHLGGIPYSLTLHGDLGDYGPNQREKWAHCAFGLAVTSRLVAQLNEQLSGSLPSSISVAPMGVDLARFTRRVPYEPWRGGPARIFSCGRLNPGKGHSDLIRAVHLLRTQGLDARLAIAGEDDLGGTGYRHSLEALIAELGLSKSVTLLGAISEEHVLEQLENAHIFVLGSHVEAIGVATMEAMAMQVPVVVTGVGGVAELVEDGVNGLLVTPGDPSALAGRCKGLLGDPGLAASLASAGRQKVATCFSSDRSAEILARCLTGS